jgi:hypothetical protein
MKTYRGKYRVKNIGKYKGNPDNVIYRSSWEMLSFKYLDNNPNVKCWNSEEVIIPYRCQTDNKIHRYFIDLFFETVDGQKFLIEIKPEKETKEPKIPKRKTKRFLNEVLTWGKNQSKWESAKMYAENNNMVFSIWTEKTLKKLGIKIMTPMKTGPRKKKTKKRTLYD